MRNILPPKSLTVIISQPFLQCKVFFQYIFSGFPTVANLGCVPLRPQMLNPPQLVGRRFPVAALHLYEQPVIPATGNRQHQVRDAAFQSLLTQVRSRDGRAVPSVWHTTQQGEFGVLPPNRLCPPHQCGLLLRFSRKRGFRRCCAHRRSQPALRHAFSRWLHRGVCCRVRAGLCS